MNQLALNGGQPVRPQGFARYNTIGAEERQAVLDVLDGGELSRFLGKYHRDFYGGTRVRALEEQWAAYLGIGHAVAVNSATSGLNAAIGALGIGPGDELIVPSNSMSASSTCILVYNAVPVFADVRDDIFVLDADAVRRAITPRTKAIIVVHLLGHPADMDPILDIARQNGLRVVEDAAQAPGGTYKGRHVGTLGDIGVFSLNYHKTIHAGEGGIAVTDSPELARRLQLIRNHGEAVVGDMGVEDIVNTLGWNYRMTEIEAAIGSEQLKKLETLTLPRIELANYLTERLSRLDGLTPPAVMPWARHVYYVYALKYDSRVTGIPRSVFSRAVNAEGIPLIEGLYRPTYLEPLYQRRLVYGRAGCPFTCGPYQGTVRYEKGICPTAERLYEEELIYTDVCRAGLTRADMDDVVTAFEKVLEGARGLV